MSDFTISNRPLVIQNGQNPSDVFKQSLRALVANERLPAETRNSAAIQLENLVRLEDVSPESLIRGLSE